MDAPQNLQYTYQAAEGVYLLRTLLANVLFLGHRGSSHWVLVDAGIRGYANEIRRAAEECFGAGTKPEAILLTHGHFDHVGSLHALLRMWPVPVFAHTLEMPHLTGRLNYPPPDPLAGGGMMAWSSRLYPRGPIDVGPSLLALPQDRSVPSAPGWEWIHTPGHTAGHVSFYRAEDKVLVAGDAVTTVKQESLTAVATQRPEVHGPPAYFTTDWDAARDSVWRLTSLHPDVLATGHGVPMRGAAMRHALHMLATHFDEVARPRFGRYARTPARLEPGGSYHLPPDPFPVVAGAIALAAAGLWLARRGTSRSSPGRHTSGLPRHTGTLADTTSSGTGW